MERILVIAPHADDEVLGCGALMGKMASEGKEVFVLVCTNAHVGAPELFSQEIIDIIRREAIEAHKFLGVFKSYFLELPAPALDYYPSYKISIQISKVVNEVEPDTVFIPHRGDSHKDHRMIHEAAMVAVRPRGNYSVKNIYAYETLSETEWVEPIQSEFFIPTKYVSYTEKEFEKKLEAMSFFKSQLAPFPASRSLEAIEALGKYRGACISRVRAEAFEVLREID
jgi:Uncharacterized proteins, LmbE homologs